MIIYKQVKSWTQLMNSGFRCTIIRSVFLTPVWIWSIFSMFTLTVASSEHDAIQKSLKGFHLMSSTLPLWPEIFGCRGSTLPVCENTDTQIFIYTQNWCLEDKMFSVSFRKNNWAKSISGNMGFIWIYKIVCISTISVFCFCLLLFLNENLTKPNLKLL